MPDIAMAATRTRRGFMTEGRNASAPQSAASCIDIKNADFRNGEITHQIAGMFFEIAPDAAAGRHGTVIVNNESFKGVPAGAESLLLTVNLDQTAAVDSVLLPIMTGGVKSKPRVIECALQGHGCLACRQNLRADLFCQAVRI